MTSHFLQLYLLSSLMVFALAIGPFLRDPSNPKSQMASWLFLGLTMVLSPITLPNMLCRLSRGRPIHRAQVGISAQTITL
jgi:hypothetical protein